MIRTAYNRARATISRARMIGETALNIWLFRRSQTRRVDRPIRVRVSEDRHGIRVSGDLPNPAGAMVTRMQPPPAAPIAKGTEAYDNLMRPARDVFDADLFGWLDGGNDGRG